MTRVTMVTIRELPNEDLPLYLQTLQKSFFWLDVKGLLKRGFQAYSSVERIVPKHPRETKATTTIMIEEVR